MADIRPAPALYTASLDSEADTARLMADLALLVSAGDVVTLSGELGAGKTAAARALIRHLSGDDAMDVPSPTFTLVQSYEALPLPVIHADLYRVGHADELEELGLVPWPEDMLCLVEWPERAAALMPQDRIDVLLLHRAALGPTQREAIITGHGSAAACVARLARLRTFLAESGLIAAGRARMAGDASTRSYARLADGARTVVLMNAPRRPDGPPVRDGRPYSRLAHLAEDVTPFVAMAKALRERGFSAPAILHADLDPGFLIIEDLGGVAVVEGTPPAPIAARYEAAIDMLAALHRDPVPGTLAVAPHLDHVLPTYDLAAFQIEAGLLVDWYLPDRGRAVTGALRAEFDALWRDALEVPLAAPPTWVLRDFHSPNLIWLGERPDTARVGLIDFQDAVMGPAAYDVASLAQDARVDVGEALEIALVTRYVKARRADDAAFDAAGFAVGYAALAAQRATKILGIFARLNRRDGKPAYLRHQPRVWNYLMRALAHPALGALRQWYASHVPEPPAGNREIHSNLR
ncbi:MAG: tRNA (adenosine(37)-N6)-threonylcarbamoyltransferase complex ATPase subunit type 1 TsaE [Xanthobacteraceae bacterium]|nr:MAG: tRNA (adenosine(37)-N6)-threonylcarbamoyltransferase complex ATPase subunit type 1 TsaE [Xanthobacteraceae bacterium]